MFQIPTSDTRLNWRIMYYLDKNDLTESVYNALDLKSYHVDLFSSARNIKTQDKGYMKLSRKMFLILIRKQSFNNFISLFKF